MSQTRSQVIPESKDSDETSTHRAPNETATSEEFEFAALSHAVNYREVLLDEFGDALSGDVLEVGAGIGQMIERLQLRSTSRSITALEPDPHFAGRFRRAFPEVALVTATTHQIAGEMDFDAILCVNVLEHIHDDTEELIRFRRVLAQRNGRLCLLVPARMEIYAPIDKDFGHWRRYHREELEQKLIAAGFAIERLGYFNLAGYLAWAINFKLLRHRHFKPGSVKLFDRLIFPWTHRVEKLLPRLPVGQSLLAIARASGDEPGENSARPGTR